ncbi:MAG TPA: hypothetical protein VFV38_35490 [Ktedonobacteraceae bacterium]|nr:hypothetical protein [Ktedonobacteraceae bacterium]
MDVTITINFWFLVSLCLVCTLIGVILGVRSMRGHGDRFRY